MNIDRYMTKVFFEIRRNLPAQLQTDMKISSPDIGDIMVRLYLDSDDENIKRLTELFLEHAGENWVDKIRPKKRYYRGSEVLLEQKDEDKTNRRDEHKMIRIYRGQVVD